MIRITVMPADDTRICEAYLHTLPRVGEYLWLTGSGMGPIAVAHGTTSFVVEEVAHWISPAFVPVGVQGPIHSAAVYVKPQLREETTDV